MEAGLKNIRKKCSVLAIILFVLVSGLVNVFGEETISLVGPGLNGYNETGISPVILEIKDDKGNIVSAYPYISTEELERRSGINYIKRKEEITAIQYAIWHYTNSMDFSSEYNVVNELYDYLINLEPIYDTSKMEKNVYIFTPTNGTSQMLIGVGKYEPGEVVTRTEIIEGTTVGTTNKTIDANESIISTDNKTTDEESVKESIITEGHESEFATDRNSAARLVTNGDLPKTADSKDVIAGIVIFMVAGIILFAVPLLRKKE